MKSDVQYIGKFSCATGRQVGVDVVSMDRRKFLRFVSGALSASLIPSSLFLRSKPAHANPAAWAGVIVMFAALLYDMYKDGFFEGSSGDNAPNYNIPGDGIIIIIDGDGNEVQINLPSAPSSSAPQCIYCGICESQNPYYPPMEGQSFMYYQMYANELYERGELEQMFDGCPII